MGHGRNARPSIIAWVNGTRSVPATMVLVAAMSLLSAGCKRQDTESLGRIGRKVMERTQAATAGFREKIDGFTVKAAGSEGLQARVLHRLRWEKSLADDAIEVVVHGKEVELRGTVKNFEHRMRAIALAEGTVGVDAVTANLVTSE